MRLLLRLFIPLGLALCLLLGCGKPAPVPYPPTLVEAARLSEHEAARALPLLEALADSLDRLDEEGRVYYDLLRLRVNDKLNVRATSDTLIRRITAFYEAYGDPDKLMLAYYYRGRVCADLNDALQAVEYYRKAIAASKETKQYLLLSNIYSQMGEILEYQNMYEEAIPAYQKSYEYTLLSGDSVTLSMPLRDIAGAYYELGQIDSALAYYQKAYAIALETRNRKRELGILVEMSAIYRDRGNMEKAFELLYPSLLDSAGRDMTPTYYSLGKLYLLTGQLDSAAYWMSRVRLDGDIYKRAEWYNYMAQIAGEEIDYKQAFVYYDLYRQCQDSIVKVDRAEDIRRIKALYDYNLHEQARFHAEKENERMRLWTYQIAMIALVLFSLLVFLLFWQKKRKQEIVRQADRWKREKDEQYRDSQIHLERNLKKIGQMEKRLEEALSQKDFLQVELIRVQKELLGVINQRIELRQKELTILNDELSNKPIYIKFHTHGVTITEEDWSLLQKELNHICNFTERLYALYPKISEQEIRICCLIKISMKVSDMAKIMFRSVSTISSIRSRLYKKITGEEGAPENLDKLILDI